MTHLPRAKEVFRIELAGIRAVAQHLDGTFDRAIEAMTETLERRGKIVLVGVGKSGSIGKKIAATLTSTGAPAVTLDPVDALHGDLGLLGEGDLVLALSYSGETEELLNLLPALKRLSITLIALTGNPRGTLARHSQIVLNTRVPREACPFNLAPTASSTATLVLGDALAMALLQARGFRKQDFAHRHPSGTLGRSLLEKVKDIMRQGERHAVCPESTPVKTALLKMTQAKSGVVCAIDRRGRLSGVFTDGDLRRLMARPHHSLDAPLRTVMTRHPVHVREEALAAEAVAIFNRRKIDDLVVVNRKGEPVGHIDSQDLARLNL
ncbi:MAG: KpsF/GutQ family sugar-phosphate isomerase [Verrucomicrobia bacterium]|nr:KpsF/GutQ family sugar-phosphate isomerase [Verrucomicrobiota bacterium]